MPSPPDLPGYEDPVRFEYPTLWLQVGAGVLALASVVGFLQLATVMRGAEVDVEFGPAGPLSVLLVVPVTIAIHEAVHGLVARRLGYRTSYGVVWWTLSAYVAAFQQRVSRRDGAVVAVAPLAVLTPLGTALLPFVDGPLFAAVYVGLVTNVAIATGDLYTLYRLARLPPGTIRYDLNARASFVYEPSGGGDEATASG